MPKQLWIAFHQMLSYAFTGTGNTDMSEKHSARSHVESKAFLYKKLQALEILTFAKNAGRMSVIMSSFGKDSLALLALATEVGLELPIAYFEPNFVEKKHLFARNVAGSLTNRIVQIEPHRTTAVHALDSRSLSYGFKLLNGATFEILMTFEQGEETHLRCGLQAPVRRHSNHPPYPWDTLVTGRRSSDFDVSVGSLRWDRPVEHLDRDLRVLMPLLHWTDQDIFYFLQSRGIEPDRNRYQVIDSTFQSEPRLEYNPDHAPYCVRCLTHQRGSAVSCPLSNTSMVTFASLPEAPQIAAHKVSPAVLC